MGDRLRPEVLAGDFPALVQRIHGQPLAYLDNAATTQMPLEVLEAMRAFEARDRANIHRGVHTLSQRATDAYEAARRELGRFAGAGPAHEVVFTSGTTEALNLVAHGLSDSGIGPTWLRPGDEIVVSGLEHHANLVPWQAAARRSGATLKVLLPDAQGRIDEAGLARLLGPRARVVALTACANATGYCPPVASLLALARRAGALTVLDAAQAASHAMPAIESLECDFMAFSGHKMHGPMGIGVLVGRRDALDQLAPLRLGGDMVEHVAFGETRFAPVPARLEGGTPNVAGAIGMAAAAGFIDAIGRDWIHTHVNALRRSAAAGLARLPNVRVIAADEPATAIVSFVAEAVHPHDIGTLLDGRGIAVRTGHHCAQPLLDHLGLGPTTRASFALYNTAHEVERLIDGVASALQVLR
jgi:cysteine desulfurase/selenocysteine lyase